VVPRVGKMSESRRNRRHQNLGSGLIVQAEGMQQLLVMVHIGRSKERSDGLKPLIPLVRTPLQSRVALARTKLSK
jgi:hypothetical protein